MPIFLTVLGTAVILIALQDLFHTLFHPAATGDISDLIAQIAWRVVKTVRSRNLSTAGPLAFLLTVGYWAASLVLGFALVYAPRLPGQFTFSPGINPQNYESFGGAVDLSFASLLTRSVGANAKRPWIDLLMSTEALLGFGLLTASVSWILSIYPVLEHKRSLAHQASLLHFAETKGMRRLEQMGDSELQELLLGMSSKLDTHRNELTQFPITYYFYEQDKETALAGVLPYLADIAEQNVGRGGGAGLAATTLGGMIDDYLKLLAKSFLHGEFKSREEILRAFAEDHRREIVCSPRPLPKAA